MDMTKNHNEDSCEARMMYKGKNGETPSNKPQCGKRTYTVDEVKNILGVSKSTAYELVKSNEFKSIYIGRHIRVSKKSFDEWLDSHA